MYRSSSALLLLLGVLPLLVSSSSKFELDHRFSKTVHPCENFYEFVYNPGVNGNESFAYQQMRKFETKIIEAARTYSDPLFDLLKEKGTLQKMFSGDRKRPYWNPYLNLITAKIATERSLWITQEMEYELNHIGAVLVEETVAQIQKQAWIPEDRKAETIQFMKNIKKVLTFSDVTKNLRNIEIAIRFYISEFEANKEELLARLSDETCDDFCSYMNIGGLISNTLTNYNLKYNESDYFVDFHTLRDGILDEQVPIYHSNAYNAHHTMVQQISKKTIPNAVTISDTPAFMFHMTDDLPIGLRWSTVALSVAHELFHSLDPNKNVDPRLGGKASDYLRGLPEFEEAANCYEDYYGSFGAETPNGTIFKPNGTVKVGEGFADVEGMRIILRVLQKTLFSKRAFKSSYSYSTYSDLEWFFFGVLLNDCDTAHKDDFSSFKAYEKMKHPRPTVRMNAWVRQLDEFSRLFGCKPEDPMYVVEKQCKTFPYVKL